MPMPSFPLSMYNKAPERSAAVDNGEPVQKQERTEVSRMKFMINQLKGNMQESEMRASAAENRVAMLQKQVRDLEKAKVVPPPIGKDDDAAKIIQATIDQMEKDHVKKVGLLNKTISGLTNTLNIFKKETTEQMETTKESYEKVILEWEEKYKDLQIEIKKAGSDLVDAREEASELRKQIQSLEAEMSSSLKELKGQLVAEIKQVTFQKDSEISVMRVEAENIRNNLLEENERLEQKLMASKEGAKVLMKDLEKAKMEITSELITFKEKTEKELDAVQTSLQRKEDELQKMGNHIDELEAERRSVRKLLKAQGLLIGKRISKLFRRNSD